MTTVNFDEINIVEEINLEIGALSRGFENQFGILLDFIKLWDVEFDHPVTQK